MIKEENISVSPLNKLSKITKIETSVWSPMTTTSYILLFLLLLTTTVASSPPSQHSDRIIEAMISGGDFHDWAADFLSSVDDTFGVPLSATIFIPTDFDAVDTSSTTTSRRLSVAYHIVPHRLSFSDLQLLEPLSRLPTLLPGNSIVVTTNSLSGYTLDGVLVSQPDLFLSSSVAIHGVASSFDFSRYGDASLTQDDDSLTLYRDNHRPGFINNQTSASVSISKASFLFPLALALL